MVLRPKEELMNIGINVSLITTKMRLSIVTVTPVTSSKLINKHSGSEHRCSYLLPLIISQHVEDVHRHVRMQAFAGDAGEFAELGNETQHILSLERQLSRFAEVLEVAVD